MGCTNLAYEVSSWEDCPGFAEWQARCKRDLKLSARVDVRVSTQDVSVVYKDVKMTFTGAVANLGED